MAESGGEGDGFFQQTKKSKPSQCFSMSVMPTDNRGSVNTLSSLTNMGFTTFLTVLSLQICCSVKSVLPENAVQRFL